MTIGDVDFYGTGKPEVEADGAAQKVSRSELINPIVEKLRDQAGAGQPLGLVNVLGAVKEPGEYPLISEGGLPFLVQLAGGLEDGAYMKEVEVRRTNVDEDRAAIEILSTNLNSKSSLLCKVGCRAHKLRAQLESERIC